MTEATLTLSCKDGEKVTATSNF
jgi:S-phase kinase-associated protein 1